MDAMKLIAVLGAGAIAVGCVEKSQELSSAEREQLAEYVGTERPDPEHELSIQFENKVELIGYDVEPDRWTPGQPITVTWYWSSKSPLEEGWLLFTHIADASGNNRLNSDGESVVRRLYQPGRWKAGEFVRDQQRIVLPEDWSSPRATFYLGVWNGPHRLQVTEGPNDGENRARALTIDVAATEAAEAPQPAVPTLRATKLAGPLNVDGRLDEEAWQRTPATPRFVHTMNGGAAEPNATAKVLWDDQSLYLAFEVQDDFLKTEFENRDDHLWEQDAVEVMIDPNGDGRGYFEMQVSPTGVVFDTRYDTRREPQPFGHVDWNSDLRAGVQRRGTPNDDEADEGYTVEVAIPWSAFAAGEPATTKPNANDVWRVNLFVMDAREDGQRAVAWSPPRVGDFHVLDRFGRVVFFDPATPQQPGAAVPTQAQPRLQLPPGVMNQLREQVGNARDVRAADRPDPRDRPRPGEPVPTRDDPNPAAMATPMTSTTMAATPMGGATAEGQ